MGTAWAAVCMAAIGAATPPVEPQRYEFTQVHMGMPFTLIVYAPDEALANRATTAAFERIAQLDGTLSDYKPESELSRLSKTAGNGSAVALSDDLWRVLSASQELAEKSAGAFDVTAGPYVRLWRRARRDHLWPSASRLAEAREAVGYRFLQLDREARTAILTQPNMRLDLGGIAVGYALDEALSVLNQQGVTIALLDGSGDVRAGDPPPAKPGWRVGIAPPAKDAPPSRFLLLANASATTSGDTYQYVELDGQRYSHIVDPRTGLGLTTRLSVTVVAKDAVTADSLATAASVLGIEKGTELIGQYDSATALFMRAADDHSIETTAMPGFERFETAP